MMRAFLSQSVFEATFLRAKCFIEAVERVICPSEFNFRKVGKLPVGLAAGNKSIGVSKLYSWFKSFEAELQQKYKTDCLKAPGPNGSAGNTLLPLVTRIK